MAYDPGLAQRIGDLLSARAGLCERSMFGGLAFLCDGHMFVGVMGAPGAGSALPAPDRGSTLMVRVGAPRHGEALALPHVREMDFTGRPMKGYVYVDAAGLTEDDALRHWIDWALQFVATLPAKAAQPARRGRPTA